VDKVAVRASE